MTDGWKCIKELSDELEKWESDNVARNLFGGELYPSFMEKVPKPLRGQAFFPGGDGLWREPADIANGSNERVSVHGIMIVGNDLGNAATFKAEKTDKQYEEDLTWVNLRPRIELSRLPREKVFFTNAVMGLRKNLGSKDKIDWMAANSTFAARCRRFLETQIRLLRPRLVIVIGQNQLCVTYVCFPVSKEIAQGSHRLGQIPSHGHRPKSSFSRSVHKEGASPRDLGRRGKTVRQSLGLCVCFSLALLCGGHTASGNATC